MGTSLPGTPTAASTPDALRHAPAAEAAPRPPATWALLGLLLWLGVLLLSPTLGPDPDAYLSGDPLHYAAIAKSTLQSDDWMMLKLGDQPYFNKPPFMFWAAMTSYRLFGISTWSAEVPGILAGLGVMLGTFLLGTRLIDRRHGFVAAV
ncbi:MAG TPA: glycosyltransferase family 39 protein, partial [Planctomycetota bacterium]|nr:glycosyltransferase family 39 protein [Planctomycetota bacterium]